MLFMTEMLGLLKFASITLTAYLDPGSGSFILQVLVASLVGIGFVLRGYWSKVKNLFRKGNIEDDLTDEDDE